MEVSQITQSGPISIKSFIYQNILTWSRRLIIKKKYVASEHVFNVFIVIWTLQHKRNEIKDCQNKI